jgi:hypothetical protein
VLNGGEANTNFISLWFEPRGAQPRSTALVASMLTITPPVCFGFFFLYYNQFIYHYIAMQTSQYFDIDRYKVVFISGHATLRVAVAAEVICWTVLGIHDISHLCNLILYHYCGKVIL